MFKDMRRNLEKIFTFSEGYLNLRPMSVILRPKLKFYLFPLTQQALKKGPTQKMLFKFSVKNIFLNFIATRENCPCKQCYLSKLFVYLILLPIVRLYS